MDSAKGEGAKVGKGLASETKGDHVYQTEVTCYCTVRALCNH